jgi:hypothetical protein
MHTYIGYIHTVVDPQCDPLSERHIYMHRYVRTTYIRTCICTVVDPQCDPLTEGARNLAVHACIHTYMHACMHTVVDPQCDPLSEAACNLASGAREILEKAVSADIYIHT